MGHMRESLNSWFLRICPLEMEKGEGAALPTQGQVVAVTGNREVGTAAGAVPRPREQSCVTACRNSSQEAPRGVMIQADLQVSLTYTTSWMLQNKAAHAQCSLLRDRNGLS